MIELLTTIMTLAAGLTPSGTFPWLSVVTFGPLIGVLALLLMPREQEHALRTVALITTLVALVVVGVLPRLGRGQHGPGEGPAQDMGET